MSKKSLFILVLIAFTATSFKIHPSLKKNDEVSGYYKTYADYASGKMVKMDYALNTDFISGILYVRFMKSEKLEKVKCKDIWGFMFKNQLFRNCHEKYTDYPCAVVSTGKIVYYEIGSRHLNALENGLKPEEGVEDWGHACYFSKTLSSEMLTVSNSSDFQKFKKAYVATDKILVSCMEKNGGKISSFPDCVKKYNSGNAPVKKPVTNKH